jgi:hypothetical protein
VSSARYKMLEVNRYDCLEKILPALLAALAIGMQFENCIKLRN